METTKMLIIPSPEGVFSRSSVKVASANTNSKYCKKGVNIKNASTYLNLSRGSCSCRCCSIAIGLLATAGVLASSAGAIESETLSNIPLELSGECVSDINSNNDCKKPRIQKPKSRKAESCTVKCVNTCIRGGEGEGPFNIRRPLVVFKSGFRSRRYCLEECSDICNLIGDGDDGP